MENKEQILSDKSKLLSSIIDDKGLSNDVDLDEKYEQYGELLDEYVERQVKDKTLRILAEFDNYKKRTNKQISEIRQITKFDTLSKFIDILDDWKFFEEEVNKSKNKAIKTGFGLIDKKINSYLKEMEIIDVPTDCKFNEDLHEAITTMDDGKEKGTILKVVSNGYMIGDKIIKYPKVIVQK